MRIKNPIPTVALAAILAVPGLAVAGTGHFFTDQGVKYEILDDEAHTVGLFGIEDGTENYLYLPASIEIDGVSYRVTEICDYAFEKHPTFYYISMPEGLERIGDYAFNGCPMIKDIEFPSTLQKIGKYAFAGSRNIEKLKLPEAVSTIGEGAFSSMDGLKKVVMQDCAVTDIPASLYKDSKELNEVYLPLAVKSIGDYAFNNTLSLTELYFPEGLERIGKEAFCGQSYDYGGYAGGLSKIEMPSTLVEIGEGAFNKTPLYEADLSKTALTEIKESTFSRCYNLCSVTLPSTLETIGGSAFSLSGGNSSIGMIAVEIPESVRTIGENAFNSVKLTAVKVGDNVVELPCNSLGSPSVIEIGAGVKSIDVSAFDIRNLRVMRLCASTPPAVSAEYNLTEEQRQNITVVINDGCLELYSHHPIWSEFNLVEEGKSRVSVTLDGSVGLGEAIYNASGVLPSRVTSLKVAGTLSDNDMRIIRENMFSLTTLDIAETDLSEIGASQFSGMDHLTNMVLPKSLRKINGHAFYGCRSLRISELPDGVIYIGKEAFAGCSSLQISRLPASLTQIDYMAFTGCISLRSIVAGENLKDFGQASFSSCQMLEYVDLGATKITMLKANALYLCPTLRTLILPETVTKLDYRALAITGLRSVEFPGALNSIGKEVFYDTPLRAVAFGEGLADVPDGVFENCQYLVSASFPSTLRSVGAGLFRNNSRLRMMSCAAVEAPTAASGAFDGIMTQKATLTIPKGSFFSYINAPQWGRFGNFDASLEVKVDENVDVNVIPEDEYQELAEEERLLQEQLDNEAEADKSESPEMKSRKKAARKAASLRLLDGSQFAKVFNGASLNWEANSSTPLHPDKGNRFFIRPKNGGQIDAVLYNGENITDRVVDGILILPSSSDGLLEIVMTNAGVESVAPEFDPSAGCTAYSLDGVKVYEGAYVEFEASVESGVYIVRTANGATRKVAVR